jgi:N-acetyl sugar amidotransferase
MITPPRPGSAPGPSAGRLVRSSPSGASLRVQVCTKTVMDTTDPDIIFDADGACNYWHEYHAMAAKLPDRETRDRLLAQTVAEIKAAGRGKRYDSLIGLSGGVDSSYLAHLAKRLGLRPLAVHFDNGWNSELAVGNIEMLVTKLGYDLETFVMDWDEFRDLQRAYFKASVVDLEVPTDHMILGALHKTASQHGIKHLLSGTNISTEWLLPKAWHYRKFDLANLKAIHHTYGELPLKRLPALGVWQQAYYQQVRGIRSVELLNLIDFNKAAAKAQLINELGWRDYGGKHFESIFTRFYQGYILPRKFGADKRRAHLSSLILSGQITRDEALRQLQQPTYDEALQQQDKAYIAKKLGFAIDEFEALLTQPNRTHEEFGTDLVERQRYFTAIRSLKMLMLWRRKGPA